MENQTLHDVDNSLVDAGEFLKDVARDQQKVQCLKIFAECKGIVKWLREVTNG